MKIPSQLGWALVMNIKRETSDFFSAGGGCPYLMRSSNSSLIHLYTFWIKAKN